MYGTAPLWQANIATGKTLQMADYHYIITDHLGTPTMTVNKDGQVTWQALSEAFGKTMPSAQNQITMNLRFPGQYYDQETGTHYNYFRDYNPQTGRYIQRDPIGLRGGINTYGYVNGNSLNFIDPRGLNPAQWGRDSYGELADIRAVCPPPNECYIHIEEVVGDAANITVRSTPLLYSTGQGAITNRDNVYTGVSCKTFWDTPRLFLHEFYHVIKQWRGDRGSMGINEARYLRVRGQFFEGQGREHPLERPAYAFGDSVTNQKAFTECRTKCEQSCPNK